MKTKNTILIIIIFLVLTVNLYAVDKDLQTAGFGFYKGITSVNEEYADPNSATEIENYDFKEDGLLQARGGWYIYNDLKVDTPVENLFIYKDASKINHYIASTGKDLFDFSYLNSTKLTIPLTLTDFDKRGFISQNNLLFIGDGVNPNIKYNGTEIKRAGITRPTAQIQVDSIVVGGNLSPGTYKYRYTYYSDTTYWNLLESEANLNYAELQTVSTSQIILNNISISSNNSTTKRRIWRTKNTGIEAYYLLGTIDNNTDTYFIDNLNDTQLSSIKLDLTQGREPLPPSNIFTEYKGYVFSAGNSTYPSRLYWSGLYLPEYHNIEFDYWEEPDRQTITGLAKTNGHLIIFTKNKTHSLFIPN